MKVYNYDSNTLEYIGEDEAKPSPLEKDVFLIPAHATTKNPMPPKNNYARCFIGGEWIEKEDNRGKVVYSKDDLSETTISYIGPIKDIHTDKKPKDTDSWVDGSWVEDAQKVKDKKDKDDIKKVSDWERDVLHTMCVIIEDVQAGGQGPTFSEFLASMPIKPI